MTALEVRDLTVDLDGPSGPRRAVDSVSFSVHPGETLALLGESGCGKSMTASAITGLLDPVARVSAGAVSVSGTDLLRLAPKARRASAGRDVGLVVQDALAALNPVVPVGVQIAEPFRIHRGLGRRAAKAAAIETMRRAGIPDAANRYHLHPHQFSGGLRQRLVIAAAIALTPAVLIADEPTTALDVTVQAQIMRLLGELREQHGIAVVLITHDLGVVAQHADRVAVMYAGRIVETGPVAEVFATPHHPYTAGLLDSVPGLDTRGDRLRAIAGTPPSPAPDTVGCHFRDRCRRAVADCTTRTPTLQPAAADRAVACFSPEAEDA